MVTIPHLPRSPRDIREFPIDWNVKELKSKGQLKEKTIVEVDGFLTVRLIRSLITASPIFWIAIALISGFVAWWAFSVGGPVSGLFWFFVFCFFSCLILQIYLEGRSNLYEVLGRLDVPDAPAKFSGFLDKFGRKKHSSYGSPYWYIDYGILLLAYRAYKNNPEEFQKAVKLAENKKELLRIIGVS